MADISDSFGQLVEAFGVDERLRDLGVCGVDATKTTDGESHRESYSKSSENKCVDTYTYDLCKPMQPHEYPPSIRALRYDNALRYDTDSVSEVFLFEDSVGSSAKTKQAAKGRNCSICARESGRKSRGWRLRRKHQGPKLAEGRIRG